MQPQNAYARTRAREDIGPPHKVVLGGHHVRMRQIAKPDLAETLTDEELLAAFDSESENEIDMLATTLSPQIALLLLQHFPGVDLRIPQKMYREHRIARAIGYRFAKMLSDYSPQGRIHIPLRHPAKTGGATSDDELKAKLLKMIEAGMIRDEIAAEIGTSPRNLRRVLSRLGLSGVSTHQPGRNTLPAPSESKSNGGLTGGLVDFGPYPPSDTPNGAQRASESKYGFYTPQPRKDQ